MKNLLKFALFLLFLSCEKEVEPSVGEVLISGPLMVTEYGMSPGIRKIASFNAPVKTSFMEDMYCPSNTYYHLRDGGEYTLELRCKQQTTNYKWTYSQGDKSKSVCLNGECSTIISYDKNSIKLEKHDKPKMYDEFLKRDVEQTITMTLTISI